MEKLLSVAEVAVALKLHRTRVNQLIESGALPAVRIGRSFVVREADIDKVRNRAKPGRPRKTAKKPRKGRGK